MESVLNTVHFTLFKSEPGCRKSTSTLGYPKPIYYFDFDGKMNALKLPMKLWSIDPKQISYDSYTDWTSARAKLEGFINQCSYKTIVIDSLTSCADYMLRQTIKAKTGVTRQSGATAGKNIGGIAVNEIEDYNAEAAGLTELISLLKLIQGNHKIDIIIIAHIIRADYKDINGKINVSRTIVTAGKKPAAKIPAYCDEIYHFGYERSPIEGQQGPLIISTQNTGEDYARTTLNLPQTIRLNDDNLYEKWIKPAIDKQ